MSDKLIGGAADRSARDCTVWARAWAVSNRWPPHSGRLCWSAGAMGALHETETGRTMGASLKFGAGRHRPQCGEIISGEVCAERRAAAGSGARRTIEAQASIFSDRAVSCRDSCALRLVQEMLTFMLKMAGEL